MCRKTEVARAGPDNGKQRHWQAKSGCVETSSRREPGANEKRSRAPNARVGAYGLHRKDGQERIPTYLPTYLTN